MFLGSCLFFTNVSKVLMFCHFYITSIQSYKMLYRVTKCSEAFLNALFSCSSRCRKTPVKSSRERSCFFQHVLRSSCARDDKRFRYSSLCDHLLSNFHFSLNVAVNEINFAKKSWIQRDFQKLEGWKHSTNVKP